MFTLQLWLSHLSSNFFLVYYSIISLQKSNVHYYYYLSWWTKTVNRLSVIIKDKIIKFTLFYLAIDTHLSTMYCRVNSSQPWKTLAFFIRKWNMLSLFGPKRMGLLPYGHICAALWTLIYFRPIGGEVFVLLCVKPCTDQTKKKNAGHDAISQSKTKMKVVIF